MPQPSRTPTSSQVSQQRPQTQARSPPTSSLPSSDTGTSTVPSIEVLSSQLPKSQASTAPQEGHRDIRDILRPVVELPSTGLTSVLGVPGRKLPPSRSPDLKAFVEQFKKRQIHWEHLKNEALRICNEEMKMINVVSIVTGRVKAPESLSKKLQKRSAKGLYPNENALLDDQIDFVGLRIAYYFPEQKKQVVDSLKKVFRFDSLRIFERDWKPTEPQAYQKMFGEYTADHIWVRLNEKDQHLVHKDVCDQRFEIQLRSVIMDAWAGISHDLEYKALSGGLSGSEQKLIDAVKGQVEVGEMILNQLHAVHLERVRFDSEPMKSWQMVVEVLVEMIPNLTHHVPLGSASILFELLKKLDFNTPHKFRNLLKENGINTDISSDGHMAWQKSIDPIPQSVSLYIVTSVIALYVPNSGQLRDKMFISAELNWRKSESYSTKTTYVGYTIRQAFSWLKMTLLPLPDKSTSPLVAFEYSYGPLHLTAAQVKRCGTLWTAYIWTRIYAKKGPNESFSSFPGKVIAPQTDYTTGIDLVVQLSVFGLLPEPYPESTSLLRRVDIITGERSDKPGPKDDIVFAAHACAVDSAAWSLGRLQFQQVLESQGDFGPPSAMFWRLLQMIEWLLILHQVHLLGVLIACNFNLTAEPELASSIFNLAQQENNEEAKAFIRDQVNQTKGNLGR